MMVDEVARTYADALFGITGKVDQAERQAGELAEVDALVRDSAELREVILHPTVPAEAKVRVLKRLMGDGLDARTARFLEVLFAHGRAAAVRGVADALSARVDEIRNRRRATVRSVVPLDEGQTARVREALQERLGGEVLMRAEIDPTLLGGLEVRVGNEVMDLSVARRLREMRERLVGARGA